MSRPSRFTLPEPERNYRFALTPLADVMFQLLIFFMLTSNLAPYALLTLKSAIGPGLPSEGSTTGAPTEQPATATAGGAMAVWIIGEDSVSVGGLNIGFPALDDLVAGLGAVNPAGVMLVLSEDARVQDLASVLAALKRGGISTVRLTRAGQP